MFELPILTDLKTILLSNQPLIDLRAPIEFREGAMPCATNLPLMTDDERAAVGTCYKRKGQQAAIQLGHELVSGVVKAERVAAWAQFVKQHPDGALYCFRGGLRSRISQQWLYEETGVFYPRIQGGYKALRRYLLEVLEVLPSTLSIHVLTGRTGAGKTELLAQLSNAIDLEYLAHHRGSAFGHYLEPQPSQAQFENNLAVTLLQQSISTLSLVFEDESRTIGAVHIPKTLFECLAQAPLVRVEVSNEERLERTYQEYVVKQFATFVQVNASTALEYFSAYLLKSIEKIARRLGGVRTQQVWDLVQQALSHQQKTGELELHLAWVKVLLLEYYDPMYDYQLSRKQSRLVFSGSSHEVEEYFRSLRPV
ncbi:MAG: tRNA 2-selenouridine(34) synthase MnmH [Pseudomonadota bacterium]|jgi:tRNA 2-selenouridine synthase